MFYINKISFFNKTFYLISVLQGYGRTLLHQRRSEAAVRRCFYKIDVLQNFAKFTGKHLCWSHFLINLQA